MAGLNIAEDEMRPIVVKALLDGLSADTRDQLVTQAIASLMERASSERYSTDTRSVLQVAFADAVRSVAHKAVEDYITGTPAVYERIRDQTNDMLAAMPLLEEADIRDAVMTTLVNKLYDARR